MLIKNIVVDAINKQIISELAAANQYLAISFYFDRATLPQLTKFFKEQSQEEHEHALKLAQYLSDLGQLVSIPAVPQPQNQFNSAIECAELALAQEIKVSQQIHALLRTANDQNDPFTAEFLQWFIAEQVEEVTKMSALVDTIKRAGEDNLLMVEQHLAQA